MSFSTLLLVSPAVLAFKVNDVAFRSDHAISAFPTWEWNIRRQKNELCPGLRINPKQLFLLPSYVPFPSRESGYW